MLRLSSPPRRFIAGRSSPWRRELAGLEHIFLTDASGNLPDGTVDLTSAMAQASESFEKVWTAPEDMALLHFTSGTTGRPKGAVHAHEAVAILIPACAEERQLNWPKVRFHIDA